MTTYYVATLANYVLVNAANETDARELGRAALVELTGNATPNVRTIRLATDDEIELSPRLRHILLVKRNATWTDWLAKRLDKPGTVLVAVGAGHLTGPSSVRTMLAERYNAGLVDLPEVATPVVRPEVRHAWHLYAIRIRPEMLRVDRARFIERLTERGIGTSVHFIPLYRHPYYRDNYSFRPQDFPVTERVYETIVSLPLYPAMTEADVDRVVEAVRDVARSERR